MPTLSAGSYSIGRDSRSVKIVLRDDVSMGVARGTALTAVYPFALSLPALSASDLGDDCVSPWFSVITRMALCRLSMPVLY